MYWLFTCIYIQRAPMLEQYYIIYNNKSSFRSFRRGPHSAPGTVFGKFSGRRKKTSLSPSTAVVGTDKMPRPRMRCCFAERFPREADTTEHVVSSNFARRKTSPLRSCHGRIQWRATTIRVHPLTSWRRNSRIIVCHSPRHRILRYPQGSDREEQRKTFMTRSTPRIFTTSAMFTWKVKILNPYI